VVSGVVGAAALGGVIALSVMNHTDATCGDFTCPIDIGNVPAELVSTPCINGICTKEQCCFYNPCAPVMQNTAFGRLYRDIAVKFSQETSTMSWVLAVFCIAAFMSLAALMSARLRHARSIPTGELIPIPLSDDLEECLGTDSLGVE